MALRLEVYLETTNLLNLCCCNQSMTEFIVVKQLIRVQIDILRAIDKRYFAAFDTVDHDNFFFFFA